MLGKKIFKKRFNHFIPAKIDRYLRYIRYLLLFMVLYNTATMVKLAFLDIDPYFALFNFWSSEVTSKSLIVLSVILVVSFFIERPWCKYACPYGALLGIFNLFRVFKIRRNVSTCIDCGMCTRRCPMNIEVSKVDRVLNHQCISCLECTSEAVCPVVATVEFSSAGGGKSS